MTLILGMSQKVTARHVQRQAMLYVRQSTLHQVLENTESTARQYALRERAIALGWETSRIVVIDQDLGQSGASAADREGFQRLVAEVGLGHVGLVMGLEVSRLARSSLDWHHLLELCSMTGTLILDEDGLYDPATFNDRLPPSNERDDERGRTPHSACSSERRDSQSSATSRAQAPVASRVGVCGREDRPS